MTLNIGLAAALLLATAPGASAQSGPAPKVTDGSDAASGTDSTRAVLTLIARRFHSPDAKVTALRQGRAGALCGRVEVKNRMGTYTGARGFVADLAAGFVGRLPDPAELRNPTSLADYQAMDRARTLFETNCTRP